MVMPRKPAKLKTGHSQSKSDLEEDAKRESLIGGNKDEIDNVPDYLNARAKKYYDYIVSNLEVSGILTNLDVFIVRETAICLDRMQTADEAINNNGMVYYKHDKQGYPTPFERPEVGIKNKYIQQFKMLSTQLGLSPSSRSQLASLDIEKAVADADPMMKILNDDTPVK